MEFRPCIDIHNGKVKQIVGSSLNDDKDFAVENFVSEHGAAYYADLYKRNGIKGGHVILLNHKDSEYYKATKEQAIGALSAYKGGLQIGGGITDKNAAEYIDAGATHVIVTSYIFNNGCLDYENLKKLSGIIGKERLVLDLSCRKKEGYYYVMTDRWQKYTDVCISEELLNKLSLYCDEFLIHAVDAEGQCNGIEHEIIEILEKLSPIPATYAGGVRTLDDMKTIMKLGKGRINVTVGSALDIFGGALKFSEAVKLADASKHAEYFS